MAKYRKKPGTIHAALFDGELVGEPDGMGGVMRGTCPDWFPAIVREVTDEEETAWLRQHEVCRYSDSLYIETPQGTMRADPGDWIIKGIEGELFTCTPSDFAATYDAQAVA